LWAEREGRASVQQTFDAYAAIDASSTFWSTVVGDPGPDGLFAYAVYVRGAMALHELRRNVGENTFFEILRAWARTRAGQSVATDAFIALAEAISGRELDDLFQAWLFLPAKPS
jgi:aminopeptidase N